jgi:type IV pilus assembly protein PilE
MINIERACLRRFQQQLSRQTGMTLIELMIVVVIIGILAAIAYPNYAQYVQRGNRAEAKSILLETTQFLERNYTLANRYDLDSVGNAVVLPFTTSPKGSTATTKKYDITVAYGAAPAQTFTLSATPRNSMVGDKCDTLTLTNTGVKGLSGSPTFSVSECWGK